jgi:hypothetical protein
VGFVLMVWAGFRFGPALEQHLVGRLRNDRVTSDE